MTHGVICRDWNIDKISNDDEKAMDELIFGMFDVGNGNKVTKRDM